MKILYFVYTERYGEVEGMFTAEGELIDCWCNNDANWRSEYFDPMMEKLGFEIHGYDEDSPELEAAIIKIRDYFGLQYCDEDSPED